MSLGSVADMAECLPKRAKWFGPVVILTGFHFGGRQSGNERRLIGRVMQLRAPCSYLINPTRPRLSFGPRSAKNDGGADDRRPDREPASEVSISNEIDFRRYSKLA